MEYYHIFSQLFFSTIVIIKIQHIFTAKCAVSIVRGYHYTDCSNLNFTYFPSDISSKTEVINLIGNRILQIREMDLKKFTNLKNFTFNQNDFIPVVCTIEPNAFENLYSLQSLDLENNNFLTVTLRFPKNLKVLRVGKLHLFDHLLDVSYLEQLTHFSGFKNSLTKFPKFYKWAPLKCIDLQGNAIEYYPPDEIANFCKLEYLYLTVELSSDAFNNYCMCTQLMEWFHKQNITGIDPPNYACIPDSTCRKPGITTQMLENYGLCISRIDSKFVLYYEIFFVILAIFLLIFVIHYYFEQRKALSTQAERDLAPTYEEELNGEGEDETAEEIKITTPTPTEFEENSRESIVNDFHNFDIG